MNKCKKKFKTDETRKKIRFKSNKSVLIPLKIKTNYDWENWI